MLLAHLTSFSGAKNIGRRLSVDQVAYLVAPPLPSEIVVVQWHIVSVHNVLALFQLMR